MKWLRRHLDEKEPTFEKGRAKAGGAAACRPNMKSLALAAELHLRREWWYDVGNVRWSKRLARARGEASPVNVMVSWGVAALAASAIAVVVFLIYGGILGVP